MKTLLSLGLSAAVMATGGVPAATAGSAATRPVAAHAALPASAAGDSTAGATVWLCRPGAAKDPCASDLTTTVVDASGARELLPGVVSATAQKFDCFYVYPTVSLEPSLNANLTIQSTETDVAIEQASRFSEDCRVWAPMYRQVTWQGLKESATNFSEGALGDLTAYQSIRAGFEDYLEHFNDGRPIIFVGHSQGAAMLILLLSHLVDNNATLRHRLVLAIILGGNVEVPTGKLVGASFQHIPVCSSADEAGCVIAYSSFPSAPPAASVFGRPGQGVSLQSGQTAKAGLQVACVNPADIAGGQAELDPYFTSQGRLRTPWVEFPGLYQASCQHADGATWLEVTKSTGSADHRPVVTETLGPDWGYHVFDVNLALGNLVDDVAAAESSWSKG